MFGPKPLAERGGDGWDANRPALHLRRLDIARMRETLALLAAMAVAAILAAGGILGIIDEYRRDVF